ncbi:MAG TPA: tail fiber domain-containing protein [Xanthobacteraceae bacterium]|jgi:hypothetical protein
MRKLLLGSITVALAWAAAAHAADLKPVPMYKAPPPAAPPAATGYVEIYTGWASTDNSTSSVVPGIGTFANDDKLDGWPIGGAGRANYWFMSNASVQIDAQAEGTSYRESFAGSTDHFSTLAYLVAGHLNWRNQDTGLLGVFGGAGDAGGNGLLFRSVRHGLIGGEGQLYWMQGTLYLQGGYDRTVSVDSFTDNIHASFVRGTGRFFFDQNLMLEATGQYAKGARDFADTSFLPASGVPSQPFQTLLWQAKLEWKPAMLPFSFFLKYQGSETRYDTLNDGGIRTLDQRTTDQRFVGGVRLYAGQGITLQGNDRAGTTLDIIDPLGSPSSPLMFGTDQFAVSDIRLKSDIAPVGRLANGLNLYRYRYLWSETVYVGVMAQEVEAAYPASVVRGADGYLRVNYTSLGLRLLTLPEWNALTYSPNL